MGVDAVLGTVWDAFPRVSLPVESEVRSLFTDQRRMLSTMSDMVERVNTALEGLYTIERELGEGGMATVYLADDLKHD